MRTLPSTDVAPLARRMSSQLSSHSVASDAVHDRPPDGISAARECCRPSADTGPQTSKACEPCRKGCSGRLLTLIGSGGMRSLRHTGSALPRRATSTSTSSRAHLVEANGWRTIAQEDERAIDLSRLPTGTGHPPFAYKGSGLS